MRAPSNSTRGAAFCGSIPTLWDEADTKSSSRTNIDAEEVVVAVQLEQLAAIPTTRIVLASARDASTVVPFADHFWQTVMISGGNAYQVPILHETTAAVRQGWSVGGVAVRYTHLGATGLRSGWVAQAPLALTSVPATWSAAGVATLLDMSRFPDYRALVYAAPASKLPARIVRLP